MERGLSGVRVVSDTGIYAITDEEGKFHFDYIETGQHVLKIDESTLPEGSVITTDSPRKIIVTAGILTKVSFGVRIPEREKGGKGETEKKEKMSSSNAFIEDPSKRSSTKNFEDDNKIKFKPVITQSSDELKPRLSVTAEIIEREKGGKGETEKKITSPNGISHSPILPFSHSSERRIRFTIDCNYFLFVKRAELKLFDENQKLIKTINLPMPLPLKFEISIDELSMGKSSPAHADTKLYYQLSVCDQNNKEDRTSMGLLDLGPLSENPNSRIPI